MYLDYYRMHEEPFNVTPNPKFLYLSAQHEAALESLCYGVMYRKGFLVLTGEVGTGKSTLCRALINRLEAEAVDVAFLFNPTLSVRGILKSINEDFGNSIGSSEKEDQLEVLNGFLIDRLNKGKNATLVIDEAQNLTTRALEMIRLLSNLETDQKKLLQIVLVGQPELNAYLKQKRLRQLAQRVSIRCELRPLVYEEAQSYILHRLSLVQKQKNIGFQNPSIQFHNNAFHKLYAYTRGYPRVINILCDRILTEAYACRTRIISKDIVCQAWKDIQGTQDRKSLWTKLFSRRE